jgi:argininosuccinate synthase
MEYLQKRGLKVPMTKEQSYSRAQNLWHLSHEGLELENPASEPEYKRLLQLSVSPENATDKPEYVEKD